MSDLLDKELENQIEEDIEEMKRIEKQDKLFEILEEYDGTEVCKVAVEEAYAVAKAFRILLDSGIDYSNAVSIANNSVV